MEKHIKSQGSFLTKCPVHKPCLNNKRGKRLNPQEKAATVEEILGAYRAYRAEWQQHHFSFRARSSSLRANFLLRTSAMSTAGSSSFMEGRFLQGTGAKIPHYQLCLEPLQCLPAAFIMRCCHKCRRCKKNTTKQQKEGKFSPFRVGLENQELTWKSHPQILIPLC